MPLPHAHCMVWPCHRGRVVQSEWSIAWPRIDAFVPFARQLRVIMGEIQGAVDRYIITFDLPNIVTVLGTSPKKLKPREFRGGVGVIWHPPDTDDRFHSFN